MLINAAWRRILNRKLVRSSRRFFFAAAPGACPIARLGIRGLPVPEASGIGGRSSLRLVAVQRLAEKADSNGSSKGKDESSSSFSLSKPSPGNAIEEGFEELHAKEKRGFGGGLRYLSVGVGFAALFFGAGMVVREEKEPPISLASLEKAARDIGRLVISTLETLSSRISSTMGEVIDAGATALVLLQGLKSVLESYGEGVTKGWWRAKVAAFIADVSAAGGDRRKAVVCASDGVVVDWLLETAAKSQGPGSTVTQGEAARALSYLLEDEATCESVLARPHALPNLLRFAASLPANFRPKTSKHRRKLADIGSSRGKSQLVAAIMEIVTESCEPVENHEFRPSLPGSADPADIAAALAAVEEGGLKLDDDSRDDDRGSIHGIGMKLSGTTGIVAVQRLEHDFHQRWWTKMKDSLSFFSDKNSLALSLVDKDPDKDLVGYGLWDDLQGRLVAVPLAAWALATWAESSAANRNHISRLDKDGQALLAAVLAPERTVKWHGARTMHLLLDNKKVTSDEVVSTWSSALLDMAVQACGHRDSTLAESAFSAFTACFKEGRPSQMSTFEKGFPAIRELARQTKEEAAIQKSIARTLDTAMQNGLCLGPDESKRWSGILLRWLSSSQPDTELQRSATSIFGKVIDSLGTDGIPACQALLASLLLGLIKHGKSPAAIRKEAKAKGLLQSQLMQTAVQAATQLGKMVSVEARADVAISEFAGELPLADLLGADIVPNVPLPKNGAKELPPKFTVVEAAHAVIKALKALADISAEDASYQKRIIEAGGLILLRRLMLADDYEQWCFLDASSEKDWRLQALKDKEAAEVSELASHMRKHAARLLTVLTQHPEVTQAVADDNEWCSWLGDCADGVVPGCNDLKSRSYAQMTLLNVAHSRIQKTLKGFGRDLVDGVWPRYEDMVFLLNFDSKFWKSEGVAKSAAEALSPDGSAQEVAAERPSSPASGDLSSPLLDVVFIHGLAGGPIKTWRVAVDKTSTTGKGGLVEKIDEQAGREGTCWPSEWLSHDLPRTRLLSLKYKTNFSEWSGATLPLEEISSALLDKLLAAGVGERPVVFISHSMGGLVVKQMLAQAAKDKSRAHLVDKAAGVVFYSCPHFGSRLADMPWRMGYVLRPAPSVAELRSGSPRLEELNRCIRNLHYRGTLQVLSFSETKVTPLVEGYGGWALRMEVVPIESAYPGFGELVVLDGTDHVNSCKPLSPSDPAYTKTLEFLRRIQVKIVEDSRKKKEQ
ncbi:uncharacterized protein LOC9643048 [Selaginella moellendorffii]|uniref:uncharacterized protein LOC9643048 n=1 Tax=Selaginella moellendorffii TaxID=88036 RepID=UPI000D1CC41E|nr:uncharacterized protein LOC9643048 [Selaginella moellendorffii]|eukprot:XP_024534607.1 uncharacterized protein LOC9643048 [Selaginella moellendorffii]